MSRNFESEKRSKIYLFDEVIRRTKMCQFFVPPVDSVTYREQKFRAATLWYSGVFRRVGRAGVSARRQFAVIQLENSSHQPVFVFGERCQSMEPVYCRHFAGRRTHLYFNVY